MLAEIDVEKLLVWTYQDQRADLYAAGVRMHALEKIADGRQVMGWSADGCATIERNHSVGTAISSGGQSWAGYALDDDAEYVHGLVLAMGSEIASLLIRHGRAGTRPDWMPGSRELTFEPVGSYARPDVARWQDSADRRAPSGGYSYCPIIINDRRSIIRFARQQYEAWWSGLVLVAYGLRQETGRLKRYRPLQPSAPKQPWTA